MFLENALDWARQLSEYFLDALDQGSYLSIGLLMAVESSLVPFPSEIVMIPAGILVAEGRMNFISALAAAILGSLAGAFVNYYLAHYFGRRLVHRIGKYFWLSPAKLTAIEAYFEKYGDLTTFFGRLLPGIRQLISLPAGLANMSPAKFATYTACGAGIWSLILLLIGILFSRLQQDWHLVWGQYKILIVGGTVLAASCIAGIWLYFKKRKLIL